MVTQRNRNDSRAGGNDGILFLASCHDKLIFYAEVLT